MKKKQRIVITIIVAIIATALIGVGAFFGVKTIYHKGVEDGENKTITQVRENITKLADAVSEKAEMSQTIIDSLVNTPSEIDTTGITQYIDNISQLNDRITNEKIQAILQKYKSEWENFQQIYATENNNAITSAFNDLKNTASQTATEIKNTLDQEIKNTLEALRQNN